MHDPASIGGSHRPRIARREAKELEGLPRSAALSHLYRSAEAVAPPHYPPVSKFSAIALWEWIRHYLAYVFRSKHALPPYTASPQHAVYDLVDGNGSEDVRIAVAGDWATGTDESADVAERIMEFDPHFTIHLGDVYYVGDPPEINENCLGITDPTNGYTPVTWPIGEVGSFALNGNHEMYANGIGYFELFLPRLGLRGPDGKMLGQQTSFFCLQNSHWRIIAIDTGYNSIGVPILASIPILNQIPAIGGDCKLPDPHIQWLKDVIRADADRRGVILLSHHQYYSAFQQDYRRPAQQLWDAGLQRNVLWFWGHEHRLAGYDLFGPNSLKCFGRCVGHGGMPVDRGTSVQQPTPAFWDNRLAANGFGVNGHVNLAFSGPYLKSTYVDLRGDALLEEDWKCSNDGHVELVARRKITTDPDFHA